MIEHSNGNLCPVDHSKSGVIVSLLLCGLIALFIPQVKAGYIFSESLEPAEFTFFPTPTAWDPGSNTARISGFPASGGATWSIMGAGIGDVSGFDPEHLSGLTSDIVSLGGFSLSFYNTMFGNMLDYANYTGFVQQHLLLLPQKLPTYY